MVIKFFKERRYLLISIFLIALMPSYKSCNIQNPDVLSYGFPFYALEGSWAGALPNYNQLFWFGLFLNLLILGGLYVVLYYKMGEKSFDKFVKGFSIIPLYLVVTGFLWFLENYTLGTSIHPRTSYGFLQHGRGYDERR